MDRLSAKALLSMMAIVMASSSIACTSFREVKERNSDVGRYRNLAAQKFGESVEYLYNSSRTAVLCVNSSKPTLQQPQRQVRFFVFDFVADSLLHEDTIVNGSVGWRDEFSVVVSIVPGTEKSNQRLSEHGSGYIFDLRSRKATSLETPEVR